MRKCESTKVRRRGGIRLGNPPPAPRRDARDEQSAKADFVPSSPRFQPGVGGPEVRASARHHTAPAGCPLSPVPYFRSHRSASRTSYFRSVRSTASWRSMSIWLARTTQTKTMSASYSATSCSGSSAFFFLGP